MLENSRLSVVFVTRKLNKETGKLKLYARITVEGKSATRGNYKLELVFKGDANPELSLLLGKDGEAVDEKMNFEFVI